MGEDPDGAESDDEMIDQRARAQIARAFYKDLLVEAIIEALSVIIKGVFRAFKRR